jgi:phosphoglycerol transferase MdoB-like AlkP superfamily enzyme
MIKHNQYIAHRLYPIAIFFFILQLILRLVFVAREINNISGSVFDFIQMFGIGLIFDLATLTFFLLPFVFYLVVLPQQWHLKRFDHIFTRIFYFTLLYILFFNAIAEWIFWDEFNVRYNFIAVDYLVYTNEVLKNIWESYPIIWLLLAIAITSGVIFFYTHHLLFPYHKQENAGHFFMRLGHACLYTLIPLGLFFMVSPRLAEVSDNSYTNEIGKNGIYSLFSAFRNNELDYERFYLTHNINTTPLPTLQSLIANNEPQSKFVTEDSQDITRIITPHRAEKRKNVVIIVLESMSAEFMERFGNKSRLTPVLDRLAGESIFFSNMYATGTRTVRGLEAISLSVPPTPGMSIVKRANNENLYSLGFVFKDRGYDTKFIYGGYGYFDNMNYFFENNGFSIIDRAKFAEDEKTFANAWGLCDEDLFAKTIKEANDSYAKRTPFMSFVMTTSNHRPYTFPSGRIDRPSKGGGRSAGVAYSDYAVGKFLSDARKEPWFNDTIFVVIADHTAGSAGKIELTPQKYHIPAFIYGSSIKAKEVKSLASQIDITPTLIGLLNFNYTSRFYGRDLLKKDKTAAPYAFISNYQKLGLITDNNLMVLRPGKDFAMYQGDTIVDKEKTDLNLLARTITFFKGAARWRDYSKKLETTVVK